MSDQSFSSTGRPQPRSDARRNLVRILEAADEVFAAEGPAAATTRVAERAGVASGTVFRHFPTKAALLEAVFTRRLEKLAEAAEATAGAADPGAVFRDLFTRWCREFADKQLFVDALIGSGVDVGPVRLHVDYQAVRQRLDVALGGLLEAAQRSGDVRPDVTVDELNDLIVGVSRIPVRDGSGSAAVTRIVLDGLRPPPVRAG